MIVMFVTLQRTWCRYSCFVDKPDKVFIYENYKRQQEKENIQTQEREERSSQKSQASKTQTLNKRQKKEEEEYVKCIPPLNICSIKVQTILNSEARQHEIVAISYLMKYNGIHSLVKFQNSFFILTKMQC
jgi:hypothetical protein